LGGDVVAVLTPHFDLPFRLSDKAAVVEQGTMRDLANCVYLIVATPLGYRDESPNFGIVNLAFEVPPVMREQVHTSIIEQERRAEMFFSETTGMREMERVIKIALTQRESGGF
jgi:hypothetical protein